jgi:hypothetical protein
METSVLAVTVKLAVALTVPDVAVIVVVPTAVPLASPELSIVAPAVALQVTETVFVVPSV